MSQCKRDAGTQTTRTEHQPIVAVAGMLCRVTNRGEKAGRVIRPVNEGNRLPDARPSLSPFGNHEN